MREVKRLAVEYYLATGRPLGATGEIAEYEAAKKLGLTLSNARTPGYDATRLVNGRTIRIQIKGRRPNGTDLYRGRVPKIGLKGKFTCVMLVLMDERYEAKEIWQASRRAVQLKLSQPGSKARTERGSMSIRQFRAIGKRIWPKPSFAAKRGSTKKKAVRAATQLPSAASSGAGGRPRARNAA